MNIILDTNAFIYLYKIHKKKDVPNIWYNYKFDKSKFEDFCYKAENIFITSETLYELFLQSLRFNKNLELFIDQYRFFHNIKKQTNAYVSVLNSKNGMYFDMEYFADCINNNKKIDLEKYIDNKIKNEHKILNLFINTLLAATCNTFLQVTGDKVFELDYEVLVNMCRNEIENLTLELYNKCYLTFEIDKRDFEQDLDKVMKNVFVILYKLINTHAIILGKTVPFDMLNSKEEFGVDHMNKIFNKLSTYLKGNIKENVKEIFNKELTDFIIVLKTNTSLSIEETQFISYILQKYVNNRRKIKKNDIIDYLIVTGLNANSIVRLDNNSSLKNNLLPNKSNSILISFDKVLFDYSKEKNWLYKKDTYDYFLY